MGQYYKVINIDKKEYMRPNSGLKLMEWSYNLNPLILNLMKKLANDWKGDRVFIVGDYAISQDRENDSYDYSILEQIEKELGIYKKKENGYYISLYHYAEDNFKEIQLEKIETEEYKYIYNHNKKEYINLDHCPLAWLYKEKGKYDTVKISPISLTLALGNGMGGGDYLGNNENLVGMYLDDVQNLEITKEPLDIEYDEIRPEFYESAYIPCEEIKNEIEIYDRRYKIGKDITKFIFKKGNENFIKNYKNQNEAIGRISWSLDSYYNPGINEIHNIINNNSDGAIKDEGNKLIESVELYRIEKNVRHALYEIQYLLDGGINNMYYTNEVYKKIFEKLRIKNIENIVTESNKTIITFDTQQKYEIITNDIKSTVEFFNNAKYITKLSKEQKEVIKYSETQNRIPEDERGYDLYYYECRNCEGIKRVEKNVYTDFVGTLVTNKEILRGKESMKYEELFKNPKLLLLYDSDIEDIIKNIEEEGDYEYV